MNVLFKGTATVAALAAAAGVGLLAGQKGLLKLPLGPEAAMPQPAPAHAGPVIYYRDPSGKPLYSATPMKTPSGEPYIPVYASEDSSVTAAPATARTDADRKPIHYRNPMGLPDISPVPKKDSMGMDYIPVYADEVDEGNAVKVSPEKIQRSGVKTELVRRRQIGRDIRAPGVVRLDERRISVVAPRFDGYIEKVGEVTSGTHVKKGDPLVTVFGQELLNQAARLLVEQDLGPSNDEMPRGTRAKASGVGGVIGARRRLLNLGAPEAFIDEVKRTRRVPDAVEWSAPIDGVVLERNAVDGQGFKAGDVLFRIADHSAVWVMADVAEGDIGAVKAGQPVKVTARAHPGRVFSGKVAVVYPHLMKETRTAQVRIELPNPDWHCCRTCMPMSTSQRAAASRWWRCPKRRHRQRRAPGRARRQGRRAVRTARRRSSAARRRLTSRSRGRRRKARASSSAATSSSTPRATCKAALKGLTRAEEARQ